MKCNILILAALAAWTATAATPARTATETYVTNKIAAAVAALPAPDYSTNNAELVQTIQTKAPAPDFSTNNTELVGTIEATVTNNIPTTTSQLVNDGDGTNPFATVADTALVPVYSDEPDFSDWEFVNITEGFFIGFIPEYGWPEDGKWFIMFSDENTFSDYEAYSPASSPDALSVDFVCYDFEPPRPVCTAIRTRTDIIGWRAASNTNAVLQPIGDYADKAEVQRIETNIVPRVAKDATNYVNRATSLIPVWEDAPPGTVDPGGMPVLSWFRGYKLNAPGQGEKILAATNYVGEVARDVATNAAKIAAMPGVVTNIVRDISLGGIWDSQLEVWWTPRMRNGSLTYEATTNVNLNAEN